LLNKYQNSYGRKLKNSDESDLNETSDVCLSKEEIRAKIVEEIVSTERDYVQNLKDIVEVNLYIYMARNHGYNLSYSRTEIP
jgi:hypothetical protein